MGFIRDKVLAPVAGHVAKHTSPELGTKAVEAAGTDKVRAEQPSWAKQRRTVRWHALILEVGLASAAQLQGTAESGFCTCVEQQCIVSCQATVHRAELTAWSSHVAAFIATWHFW